MKSTTNLVAFWPTAITVPAQSEYGIPEARTGHRFVGRIMLASLQLRERAWTGIRAEVELRMGIGSMANVGVCGSERDAEGRRVWRKT